MTTTDSQPANRPVFYRAPGEDYPLAVSASGVTITDSTGKQYLDMSGGAAVSCLGHGHPDIIETGGRDVLRKAYAWL